MSDHVTEWLNAYFDGELTGKRLFQVEEHLADCSSCQAEIESLERVSGMLHEVPAAVFTPPERFAARVRLRIPHKQALISRKQILDVGWWTIPAGLVASWIFIRIAFVLSDILSAAANYGLLSGVSESFGSRPMNTIYWSTTLGQMGVLSGNGLNWAEAMETLTRTSLPLILLQASIALLYLSWLAIWWVRHPSQEHGQLLKG